MTSIVALFGISIAVIGGPAWQSGDDWAALFSCVIILLNRFCQATPRRRRGHRRASVPGTSRENPPNRLCRGACLQCGKYRVRESGQTLIADLQVRVSPDLSMREGHDISHQAKARLVDSAFS
jgi:divalent metal cation (Fe/Co/Zn/Cd) transporter